MSDKPVIDSLNMEALGFGVFESANDAVSGQEALVEAFNAYDWSDPAAAKDTLAYYGEELDYKFKNVAPTAPDDLFANAPVSLLDLNPQTDEEYENLFDNWVKENKAYLDLKDAEPEFVVRKKALLRDIEAAAESAKRSAGAEAARGSAGQVGSSLIDINNRFLRGVSQAVEAPVRVLTGVSLSDRLTEVTDPEYDNDFGSALVEGAGSGVGITGAFTVNPLTGTAAVVGMGVDATVKRRSESLEATGDPGIANQAAAIEAGSQALQLGVAGRVFGGVSRAARGQRIFGRAAAPAAESATVRGIVRGVGEEAGAEAAGQFTSNVAENVGTDRPAFENADRGVLEAGVIGGVVAGGLGAATYEGGPKILSESDSGARAAETFEQGGPTTPVTKQVIGPITSETVEEIFPDTTNTGEVLPTEGDVETQAPETSLKELATPEKAAFTTSDGSTYFELENGTLARQDLKGNLENPFDYTFYVAPDTRQQIGKALNEGQQVVVEKGKPWLEEVKDGKRILTPIDASTVRAAGLWVMDASEERKPNKDTVIRPVRFGGRVQEVLTAPEIPEGAVDRSLGAAGYYQPELKQTTYSKKLQDSSTAPRAMRDVATENPLLYEVFAQKATDREIVEKLQNEGIASIADLLESPSLTDSNVRSRVGVAMNNAVYQGLLEAEATGDIEKAFELRNQFQKFAQRIANFGSSAGQALQAQKGKVLDTSKVFDALERAYEEELARIAKEEGDDPVEISQSGERGAAIENAIKAVEGQITIQERAEVAKDTGDVQVINDIVDTIEAEAQERLDTDIENIEAEAQDIRDRIQKTEEKAEKTRRKDIEVLNKAIADDAKAMTETMVLGKGLSAEAKAEMDKISAEVETQIDAATKATNKLIKEAVKEERKKLDEQKKTQEEILNDRLTRARTALNRMRESAQKQLVRYKIREKGFAAAGDISNVEATRAQIAKVENRITNAADRVRAAEDAIQKSKLKSEAELEAERETEETLAELDSGVEVKIENTPRGRKVSVVTRRSGSDISKLFRKGEATKPLIALSRGLSDLSDVFRTAQKARGQNNQVLSAITKRIAENRSLLKKAETADVLTDAQKQAIAAARKRLSDLSKARKGATLESRMGKNLPKYKRYKEAQANRPVREKSDRLKDLEAQLGHLNEQKTENETKKEKRDRARAKATKVAAEEAQRLSKIGRLEEILEQQDLKGSTRRDIEQQIYLLKAADEKEPLRRDTLYRMWVANNIGSVYGAIVAVASSGVVAPISKATGLVLGVPQTFLKQVRSGDTRYKYPLFQYLGGLANAEAWQRGLQRAVDTLRTGTRLENIIPTEELVANRAKISTARYQDTISDFINYVKNLPPATTPTQWLAKYAQVGSAYSAGMFLRILSAAEAVTYSVHDHGFDRAAAAYYYNKGLDEKVSDAELERYMYSPKENWARAQAEAADIAKTLRAEGIPFSEAQQRVLAAERYQEMRPREVQIDVFKQAASVVLNAPAPGYAGILVQYLNHAAEDVSIKGVRPLKYLTPFANSIAQLMQLNMETTPLGFIAALNDPKANRTQFERHMAISSATTGTALFAAIAMYAIQGLDDEDSWFGITGMHSSDAQKRKTFQQNGGLLNSLRFGNVYVPFGESTMAMGLGAVAGFVDKVRNGEAASTDVFAAAAYSSFSGLDSLVMNMNMLRGVSQLYDGIKAGGRDINETWRSAARILTNTVKGFVPGAGVIRNIARMYDHPVEVKKDLMSAIVEGVPVLQSAYGMEALNIFGEPLPAQKDLVGIHRIFSTKRDDLDIRWLTDNGYTIPGPENIRPTKATGAVKFTYEMKHKVLQAAGPQMREVVAQYRKQLGNSANRPEVQAALRKDVNKVLAVHKVAVAQED